ncbi:MAG: nucleotidyltransferase family protein [Anaerolineae bacterium]|nr:nucleotidyltransferase family protein [Anaerolineae bacterium]
MRKNPGTTTHQAEIDLLLLCARSRLTPAQIAQLQTLAKHEIDWAYVVDLANRHEITPLLYHSLQTGCPELVPPDCLDALRASYQAITRHNLVLAGRLIGLMQLFAEHDIQAVPLKGPLLAGIAYGDITLRQFSDLDILVCCDDILRARDLLLDQGYRATETKSAVHFEDQQHDISLVHDESRVHVELHREIAQKYYAMSLDPAPLVQSAQPVTFLGKTVPGLRPDAWLLTVCAHGTKHAWEHLKFICDVGALLERYREMDWDAVGQLAHQTGTGRALWLGVDLAHDLLDAPLPQDIVQQIEQNPLIQSLAGHAIRQLFSDTTGPLGTVRLRLNHLWFQLRVQKGFRHKLHYLRFFITYWLLLPGPADRNIALPGKLNGLHFVLRPFRLLIHYGLGSLKQAWKRARSTRLTVIP